MGLFLFQMHVCILHGHRELGSMEVKILLLVLSGNFSDFCYLSHPIYIM